MPPRKKERNDSHECHLFRKYLKVTAQPGTETVYCDRAVPMFETFLNMKGLTLHTLTPNAIQHFASYCIEERELSTMTAKVMVSGAARFCEFLTGEGYPIPRLIKARLRMDVTGKELPVLQDDASIGTYLSGLTAARIVEPVLTLLRVMPFCGLRISEITRLEVDDVFRDHYLDGHPGWLMVRVKEGKRRKMREVPLLPPGQIALRQYLPGLFEPGTTREGWRTSRQSRWLWPSPRGQKHVSAVAVQVAIRKVRPYTGIPITPHALRRTYGTFLARSGVAIDDIAYYMGHDSIETTRKFYIHLTRSARLQRLEDQLKKGDPNE